MNGVNLLGNNGLSSSSLISLPQLNVSDNSSSLIAGKLTISQSSPTHCSIFSLRYPHKSLSWSLCIIIMIESVLGLFSLEVTVFSYQSLIPILLMSESTSSGFSGSSIMKQFAPIPVIAPPDPVE
jgi:hypothetical protein